MWAPIFEALWVGVRGTFWIFSRIFMGYIDVFRWWEARSRGVHYGFPVISFVLAVILTIGLLWLCAMVQTPG